MSFPQTTPLRMPPGAFLNTPAVTAKFQNAQDPARRQLFPGSENRQSGANLAGKPLPNSASSTSLHQETSLATQPGRSQSEMGPLAGTNPLPVPVARVENVPPIVKAAKAINSFLQADESFPDLDSYCRREL